MSLPISNKGNKSPVHIPFLKIKLLKNLTPVTRVGMKVVSEKFFG